MELFSKQYSSSSSCLSRAEPLIILHGLFGNQGNWASHAKHLAEHYAVYTLDARNHGRSAWQDSMSYQQMAQDISQTMDSLKLESAHFIAHSMGGKTAMQLAMLEPNRINKLVIVDIAPVDYPSESYEVLDGLESIDLTILTGRAQADKILEKYIAEKGIRDFLLTNLQRNKEKRYSWRFNLEALAACYSEIKDGLKPSGVFEKEILFIKGGNSDYILPEYKNETLRQFPKTKVKIIENAGHWVHSEKPNAFIKIVENYLAS